MRKLMVPIDGSANANRAVAHAISLARLIPDTKIVLVNVQDRLDRWYAHGLNSEVARQHLRELGEQAGAEARKLLDAAGCSYDFHIAFGPPAEVIARFARDEKCMAIVTGTRGLGELESAFLGSTSYKLLHLSDLPVTLVK